MNAFTLILKMVDLQLKTCFPFKLDTLKTFTVVSRRKPKDNIPFFLDNFGFHFVQKKPLKISKGIKTTPLAF